MLLSLLLSLEIAIANECPRFIASVEAWNTLGKHCNDAKNFVLKFSRDHRQRKIPLHGGRPSSSINSQGDTNT